MVHSSCWMVDIPSGIGPSTASLMGALPRPLRCEKTLSGVSCMPATVKATKAVGQARNRAVNTQKYFDPLRSWLPAE